MKSKVGPALAITVAILLGILIAVSLVKFTIAGPWFQTNIMLARDFLTGVPVPNSCCFSASPEVVTSVIWDERGIDTFYETSVLFIAIIGTLYILAGMFKPRGPTEGMTVIVRVIAKIVAPIIMVVSLSVALHGHLTPGGGFQGGVIFAVAPVIMIAAWGGSKLVSLGFEKDTLLSLRVTGVILIALTGIATLVSGLAKGVVGYIFLNQPKPGIPVGFMGVIPAPWGHIVIGGTLILLNIFEFLAVAGGFTLAILAVDSSRGGVERNA
jgi:multisubunit Na+/H+ antiporter MnhB subunit